LKNIYDFFQEKMNKVPIQHRNLQQHCCNVAIFHIAVQCCRDIAKSFLQYYFSNIAAMF